jgi:phosphoserine / homoserine phosphotransferase
MYIVCSDLEGVFVPEIWINVAEKTGIEELRLTTRDISDYDVLMKRRLKILDENKLKFDDIQAVIAKMKPLDGAVDFLNWLRSRTQVIFVSDTFDQFARPLMEKLGWPTLLCHTLSISSEGFISDYVLRQKNAKREAIISLGKLNYKIIAIGDSYNDIGMLKEANSGILFNPPENVKNEYPDFPVTFNYEDLKQMIQKLMSNHLNQAKTRH